MSRYVLIDFQHLAYKTMNLPPLTSNVMIHDQLTTVNTTIPNYTIKDVYRMSGKGDYFTAVCLEGGSSRRQKHFAEQNGKTGAYKETRKRGGGVFYEGINMSIQLLHKGGVSCYRVEGVEADDCIASLVKQIKLVDKVTPIDIITGDSDMLPLVDDQVSVYMRGTRTSAVRGCPELKSYYQVTPETWEEYLSYTSAYQGYYIPFNSMLLFKMIRGDKTDNVEGATRGYGKVKYTDLMIEMVEDGVDFENIFRYDKEFDEDMRGVLAVYFDEETLDKMKYIFEGIRPEYKHLAIPKQIEIGTLQPQLSILKINLVR